MRYELISIWDSTNVWVNLDLRTDGTLWGYRAEAYFDQGTPDSYTSFLIHPTREAAIRVGLKTLRSMISCAHPDGFPPLFDELLKAYEPNA